MKEYQREFITVSLYDLLFPIMIGSKSKTEGESTLINISVEAEVERKHEKDFENNILEIINNRDAYTGPMQLSSKLISCINSLNAGNFSIVFRYPVFLNNLKDGSKQMAKYNCERIIKRTSLITYKKLFKVEVPVIPAKFNGGIRNNFPDINNRVLVEVEGFEPIFAEDIIDIVEETIEKHLNSFNQPEENENIRLKLIDDIQNKIPVKFNCDSCRVKIITQKPLYSFSSMAADKKSKKEEDVTYSEEYSIM